jgi:hypothetical protein
MLMKHFRGFCELLICLCIRLLGIKVHKHIDGCTIIIIFP